jgi:hypothetical protein
MKTKIDIIPSTLIIENDDMLITISILKKSNEIIAAKQKVTVDEVVLKTDKSISKPRTKHCDNCNGEYIPTGNRQKYCTDCCKKSNKKEVVAKWEDKPSLDETLAEIEAKRKQPYQFSK